MFAHLRRLFHHSVVYGLAETVSRGIGFVLVFIYARVLTETDLGIRTAIYGASAVLSLFYTFGLDNAFLRYFMDRDLADRKRETFSTAVLFSLAAGCLFLLAAGAFPGRISGILTKSGGYADLVILLFIIMIFDSLTTYPTLVLRAESRLWYYSAVAFLRFALFIGLNILFVWIMRRGLRGVFEANLITVALLLIALAPVYRQYFRVVMSREMLKRLLAFGVPTIFTLLSMRVIDISDRYVILYLLGDTGASQLGGYTVAYTLGMVGIMVFVHSFRIAWQPFFLSVQHEKDAGAIFSRVATYYTMFIGTVFLGITLFRREIVMLYAPDYPIRLAGIVPFVSIAYVFFGFYIIMVAGIYIHEKTRYLPVVTTIAAVLNVGLNFIFVPRYGIAGAAYTTVIAYVVMVAIMYFISGSVYRVEYDLARIAGVFLFVAAPIAVSFLWSPGGAIAGVLYHAALFLLAAGGITAWLLDGEERAGIMRLIRRRGTGELPTNG